MQTKNMKTDEVNHSLKRPFCKEDLSFKPLYEKNDVSIHFILQTEPV